MILKRKGVFNTENTVNYIDLTVLSEKEKDLYYYYTDTLEWYPEVAFNRIMLKRDIKRWNTMKKHYYMVPMYNGGKKVVYMCREQLITYYGTTIWDLRPDYPIQLPSWKHEVIGREPFHYNGGFKNWLNIKLCEEGENI